MNWKRLLQIFGYYVSIKVVDPFDDKKTLAEQLKLIRLRKNIFQAELEKKIGVSSYSISRFESGHKVSKSSNKLISDYIEKNKGE